MATSSHLTIEMPIAIMVIGSPTNLQPSFPLLGIFQLDKWAGSGSPDAAIPSPHSPTLRGTLAALPMWLAATIQPPGHSLPHESVPHTYHRCSFEEYRSNALARGMRKMAKSGLARAGLLRLYPSVGQSGRPGQIQSWRSGERRVSPICSHNGKGVVYRQSDRRCPSGCLCCQARTMHLEDNTAPSAPQPGPGSDCS